MRTKVGLRTHQAKRLQLAVTARPSMSPLSIDRQTITTGHVHEAVHERTASYDHMPNRATLRTPDGSSHAGRGCA